MNHGLRVHPVREYSALETKKYNPAGTTAGSFHKAVGVDGIPLEIDGMATGITELVLRKEVFVGLVVPTRAGTAHIRGAEPLGKRPLFDRPADFSDDIPDCQFLNLHDPGFI